MQAEMEEFQADGAKRNAEREANEAKEKEALARTDKGQAMIAATDFFQKMRDGRADEAYELTTPAFQKRTTKERFEQQVEDRKRVITWQLSSVRDADVFGPKSGTSFRFAVNSAFGSISFSMTQTDDKWLVSAVDFQQ